METCLKIIIFSALLDDIVGLESMHVTKRITFYYKSRTETIHLARHNTY